MAVFSRIELPLAPSVTVGLLAIAPWLLLQAFLLAAAMETPWLLAVTPVTLAGVWRQFCKNGLLRGRKAVRTLQLRQGRLYAGLGDGREIPVTVAAGCRMNTRMALLKLHPTDSRFPSYSVILLAGTPAFPGNVPDDEFRRLRVWLRLGQSRPAPTQ